MRKKHEGKPGGRSRRAKQWEEAGWRSRREK